MSTCSLELDASAARRASFSHESFVLLVEHGFVHAPCVRSDEHHVVRLRGARTVQELRRREGEDDLSLALARATMFIREV